jgi:hypothetical protein
LFFKKKALGFPLNSLFFFFFFFFPPFVVTFRSIRPKSHG